LETVAFDESFIGDIRVIRQLSDIIANRNIDLLVTHDYKSNFYGYFACRKHKLPQLAYFHGLTTENFRMKLYNAIDRFMLRKMSRIITVSNITRQLLIKRGITPDKIDVVFNAIDSSSMITESVQKERSDKVCRVIAAGRFSHEKGFDVLLKAVAEIKDKSMPFEIHLYGLGIEENRLRQMVKRLKIDHLIRFCGFVDDILPVLSEMDFMALSSRSEGMPVIILEAWSQQLGVLATAVGGIPEMIKSGESGILVDPENVKELAKKLLWAIENREEMVRYGRRGYSLVKQKYTHSVQSDELRKLYLATAGL
jgi:glycosyltransferase involved in cell wall biosynthesis